MLAMVFLYFYYNLITDNNIQIKFVLSIFVSVIFTIKISKRQLFHFPRMRGYYTL